MRILLAMMMTVAAFAVPRSGLAQERSPFNYEPGESKKHSRVQPVNSLPPETVSKLIQERAQREAEHRRARMEARNWAGISLQRPALRSDIPVLVDGATISHSAWWWSLSSPR